MSAGKLPKIVVFMVRFICAILLAVLTLAIHTWLAHRGAAFQGLNLFAAPIAIGVGLIPLILWYRRDAYPIGLGFVLVAFFLLAWISPLFSSVIP